jgi:hypothetical protein
MRGVIPEEDGVLGFACLVHQTIVLHTLSVRQNQEPLGWPVGQREELRRLRQSLRERLGSWSAWSQTRNEIEERRVRSLVLCEGKAIAPTQLANHGAFLEGICSYRTPSPLFCHRLELAEVAQANELAAAHFGHAELRPDLHVNLSTFLDQKVFDVLAVSSLHVANRPVIGSQRAHLKILAGQVSLGNHVHHFALFA